MKSGVIDQMKIAKVTRAKQVAQGFVEDEAFHLFGSWFDGAPCDAPFTLSKLSASELAEARAASIETVPLASVKFAPPIDPRAKIICVGMNYRDHVSEINLTVADNPNIFTRNLDSIVAHENDIIRPRVSDHFDFEGEIAIIIGKDARHVSIADALNYVGGYSCFMDGSVRDYQKHSICAGKNFDRTGSIGPWIVPASNFAIADPKLETRLNGNVVQSAAASEMIFGIPEIINYVTRWTLLRPGDIIATGTPGGVGARREPPLWMKPGDSVEVHVEGIGCLRNRVVDEA